MVYRPDQSDEELAELGAYHLEAGSRRFAKWSREFLNEFDKKDRKVIEPHLQRIYEQARRLSENSEASEKVRRKIARETPRQRRIREILQNPSPSRTEQPATPAPPESVNPPVPKEPWVRGPLPGWARPLTPKPDPVSVPVPMPTPEPTPSKPDHRQLAKAVFALARLITAGLLLWAIARHPIGYYTALRLVTAGVCLYGAFTAGHDKQAGWAVLFWGMVALFQPFIPLAVTRQSWKYIDVIAAVILTASILFFQRPTVRKTIPARPTH